jgi:alpha-1,3-glucosyltransferase
MRGDKDKVYGKYSILAGWANTVSTTTYVGLILLVSLAVRYLVGLGNYSGYNNPPTYGDYEAQRHWMELTINLPFHSWYNYSTNYWRLDYPPLSGYHALVCGYLSRIYEPRSMELAKAYGYSTPTHKRFMRWTVIISELLLQIPAFILCIKLIHRNLSKGHRAILLTSTLLCPLIVIVDHAHF